MRDKINVRVTGYKGENNYNAMFDSPRLYEWKIKGCPAGNANTPEKAVNDLISRTNMESKTAFNLDTINVEVKIY